MSKKSNERKSKRRKVYINRLRKLMKEKQKNKTHKKVKRFRISNYVVNNEYTCNNVIRLLNKKEFAEITIKKGTKTTIRIPEIFSFSENADNTIKVLKNIYYCCKDLKVKELKLDYSKCKKLSLGASCVTDIITLNMLDYRKRINNPLDLKGNYPKEEAFEIFVISGLVNHLGLVNLKNKNVKSLDIITNGEQSYIGEKVIQYYNECLNTKGYELSEVGQSALGTMITEVIDNVGEHAGDLASWYAQGHYTIGSENKPGKFRLVLFNFGDTIYEGLKRESSSNYTKKILNNATKKHKKKRLFDFNWTEEVLWNLFSLQYKISRANYSSDNDRGVGTIDLIKSFLKLGKTVENSKPIMSIVSGKSNILFDGTYTIHTLEKNGHNVPTIAFNKNNSLFERQDSRYVKSLKNNFPGTIIEMEFYIDREYLDKLKENKR